MELVYRTISYLLQPAIMVFAPRSPRVRVLLKDKKGRILLVKSRLSDHAWELPGGGVEHGEMPPAAASRELYEEVGVRIDRHEFTYCGKTAAPWPFRCDYIMYSARLSSPKLPKLSWLRQIEIYDRQWFSPRHLPDRVAAHVRLTIDKKLD